MENPEQAPRRRVLDAIAPPGPNWIVEVNAAPLNMAYLRNDEIWDRQQNLINPVAEASQKDYVDLVDLLLYQAVDDKPDQLFDYMVQQCTTAQHLIVGFAKHLSGKSVSTIFQRIFTGKDLTDHFVECFYMMFFPVYFQRCYSWFSLDLLIRAHTCWPGPFKRLFQVLIQNIKVPKRALQDFVVNLKEEHRDKMMKAVAEVNFTTEQFIHNLTTINFLFLNCDMNGDILRYIFYNLETHAWDCYDNKDFGRLLLSLLKNLGQTQVSQRVIKKLIDKHGTEYKAPCLVAFDEIIGDIVAMQYEQQHGYPRFYVERPAESGFRVP